MPFKASYTRGRLTVFLACFSSARDDLTPCNLALQRILTSFSVSAGNYTQEEKNAPGSDMRHAKSLAGCHGSRLRRNRIWICLQDRSECTETQGKRSFRRNALRIAKRAQEPYNSHIREDPKEKQYMPADRYCYIAWPHERTQRRTEPSIPRSRQRACLPPTASNEADVNSNVVYNRQMPIIHNTKRAREEKSFTLPLGHDTFFPQRGLHSCQ